MYYDEVLVEPLNDKVLTLPDFIINTLHQAFELTHSQVAALLSGHQKFLIHLMHKGFKHKQKWTKIKDWF